ncbi:DUF3010 family protein [Colwellia sp. 4_MG-2023]|jgi:hypothetical protein|uniref:DUF3010 family protein n=1 Tax=unclassified Colwellia TaxID=196834 RepID=UPI001C09627C|nr:MULTISPECIES: DUF3010 family protein [unclassified Colwellia]MBU2925476.1 DUF3010 family protein [Colwellia sp. C2M11]MDO6486556.1 DUF3010 family protein [Colwellia sp. 6_MG-2023]MDO6506434.1 DUF3010 family protein [Colwellia sp. 5_MG-2023]MDO6555258.1 DUF3010 family protein [Colwellia sp. 4_MG-2023]MDO6651556.1 DUF3010 family protein [Colwellia sp. 3_MG-2023]
MKACGVEIKSNEAIICIMSKENSLYDIPHTRVQKLALDNAGDAEEVKKFQFTFAKLMEDYQVTDVIIRGRALKGKFAGGPIGFKVEAAIQLIQDLNVQILAGSFIKKELSKSQIDIDFRDTGLKQYQEQAFETVFAFLEGH